jgi:hypothetical protein
MLPMSQWPGQCLALALCAVLLFAGGCASPGIHDYPDYRSRIETATDGPLTVSVSALTPNESIETYDLPLAALGIQPVWVEVENRDTEPYWFLPQGLDPNYFPYWEAAEAFSLADGALLDPGRRERFRELALPGVIPPGATTSGFVLTQLDEGFKFIHTDFLRSGELRHISLIVGVPDFRADFREQQRFERPLYPPDEIVALGDDLAAFRLALQQLPCCATNKAGKKKGDPLNLVLVGGEQDAFSSLAERGWSPTETTWRGSVLKMMASALQREPYPYAPISPMYLFGRSQDIALQKARDNIHQRNHLRLWLAPMTFRGKPVWVGQISRDIGSRMTIHSPYLTTHKIDPDVDEARAALGEDLAYSKHLSALGLVEGVTAAPRDIPRQNLTTDPYFTDGYRAVLVFDEKTTPLDEIDFLPWVLKHVEGADAN